MKDGSHMPGKDYLLSPPTFEMVMGVKDEFEQEMSVEETKNIGEVKRLSLRKLLNDLKKSDVADKMFVYRLVLFVVGLVLMPTASNSIGTSILGSSKGIEVLDERNWVMRCFLSHEVH